MNVLLIEPDKLLGNVYEKALQKDNHQVQRATGAQDALKKLESSTPDLVILELQLASHNGVEFLYELRSYADWQTIPVIIHSLVPATAFGNIAPELGVVTYLYKPTTTLKKLCTTVSDLQLQMELNSHKAHTMAVSPEDYTTSFSNVNVSSDMFPLEKKASVLPLNDTGQGMISSESSL